MCRRASGQAFYIIVPLGLGYGVYYWGKGNHGTGSSFVTSVVRIGDE